MFQRSTLVTFAILVLGFGLIVSDGYAQGRNRSANRSFKGSYVVGPTAQVSGEDQTGQVSGRMRGSGAGFVDADGDGINDNSPLAKLDLTPEQKAAIAELRAAGQRPNRDAIQEILTEEQIAQLKELRPEHSGNRPGAPGGRRGKGEGFRRGDGSGGHGFADADGDGINDNSPLAKLDLTPEQKAAVADLRASGQRPDRGAIQEILTEEQIAQLKELRPKHSGNRPDGPKGRRGRGGRFGGRQGNTGTTAN
ncbi:MAG: hypothetical protein ABIH23_31070 [bacterium]